MVTNINNVPNNNVQVKNDKTEQSAQKQQTTVQQQVVRETIVPQPAQKQDSVSLTPQAQQFARLQEKVSSGNGIDQEKVDKIKQAITDGKYKINVEQLAKRIAEFEDELFGQ